MELPRIIEGGTKIDDRGTVCFVNDFSFENIKRCYQVSNFTCNTIRAFHGHKKEDKFIYIPKGTAIVAAVEFDDDIKPTKDKSIYRFVLSDKIPAVLKIPKGFANGFKLLEEDTIILFYSSLTLEESLSDDYRFPFDYWGTKVWEIENR